MNDNLNLILSTVFENFVKNFSVLVKRMEDSDHNLSTDNMSPYHMEGSVWTHTCCVFTQIRSVVKDSGTLSDRQVKLLALSTLFHDVGKPSCRTVSDNGKVSFKGHDFASMHIMIEYKDDIMKVFGITEQEFTLLCILVQCHTLYYQLNDINDIFGWLNYDKNVLEIYRHLTACDAYGQIRTPNQVGKNNKKLDLFELDFTGNKISRNGNKELVVLVGCPASGKDYVAEKLFSDRISKDEVEIVSFDDIRVEEYTNNVSTDIWSDYSYDEVYSKAWSWCNDNNINLFNILVRKATDAFNRGKSTVIVSNTNMTRKARRSLVNLGSKQLKVNVTCVNVLAPIPVILKRNETRVSGYKGKYVPVEAIVRMSEHFVMPTYGEGFTNIRYVYND
jgi:predicted kinase